MLDFAAIDFETANQKRSSVCSVGVVIVREGRIVKSIYKLIKPTPNYYATMCMRVHGICDDDTCNAASFPEVWAEIEPHIQDLPLVAHNAAFDRSCLRAARQTFGKRIPNHQLHTVSQVCGYTLENHHHALADAEACAHIALKLL